MATQSDLKTLDASRRAARAVGRCYGSIFFSVFGGAWLLLSALAFARLNKLTVCVVIAGIILHLISALPLLGRGRVAAKGAIPGEEQQRNDRIFGIINAITWISVALVFQILPRLGHRDLIFPTIVLIVGLHFFPMPPLYQHRANLLLGAFMVAWAIICPLLFGGDRMIGFLALGAGLALWAAAAWALNTARELLPLR